MKNIPNVLIGLAGVLAVQSASAAIQGPYLAYFDDLERWDNYSPSCGTYVNSVRHQVFEDGAILVTQFIDENDCYDSAYGRTDYTVEKYWDTGGGGYIWTYGYVAGVYRDEFGENGEIAPSLGDWIKCNSSRITRCP